MGTGYKVDYRSFRDMKTSKQTNYDNWNAELSKLQEKINILAESDNLSGDGSDSIKYYLNSIHMSIITSLLNIVFAYSGNFDVYYNEYHSEIDTDEDAKIEFSVLENIKNAINRKNTESICVEDSVTLALNRVSDIFYVSRRDISSVNSLHNTIANDIERLDSDIIALETAHHNSDFEDIYQMISALTNLIDECICKTRSFKSNCSPTSIHELSSWQGFEDAYINISDNNSINQDKYIENSEIADEHVNAIDKIEREEREKKAAAIKLFVGVVVAVASVTVIICSGGAATPLVMGTVGAISGVINKSADKLTQEYVEKGNLNNINLKDLAIDVGIAGATGFITGYIGAGIGNLGTSSLVGKIGTGIGKEVMSGVFNRTGNQISSVLKGDGFNGKEIFNLQDMTTDVISGGISGGLGCVSDKIRNGKLSGVLNSDNKISSTLTGGLIGGCEEMVDGVANRAVDGLTHGRGIDNAFDPYEMTNDFIKGGSKDIATSLGDKKFYGKEVTASDLENPDIRNKLPSNAPDPDDWIKNGGEIKQDSNGNTAYISKKVDRPAVDSFKPNSTKVNSDYKVYDSDGKVDYDMSSIDESQREYKNTSKYTKSTIK